MKTLSVALLSLTVALILASTGTATVYWEENFDGYAEGSALNGQAGPNGQTWGLVWDLWADAEIGSMAATSVGGQDGTFGAGYWPDDTTTGPNNQGSHIHMGTKATSGMLYVDFDLHVGTGRQSAPQWTFKDTDANINVGVAPDWVDNANGGFDPQTGLDLNDNSNMFWNTDITSETQDIHGSWVFDLDNKMVTFSFTSKQEPDKVATLSTEYSNDWQPDYIYLYNHAISSSGGMGYDNFRIADTPIPEPAGLALLSLGGLMLLARRRRPLTQFTITEK